MHWPSERKIFFIELQSPLSKTLWENISKCNQCCCVFCAECSMNVHHKCQKKVANLCGVNQKLMAEALAIIESKQQVRTTKLLHSAISSGFLWTLSVSVPVYSFFKNNDCGGETSAGYPALQPQISQFNPTAYPQANCQSSQKTLCFLSVKMFNICF